jgi:hypothetical protein
LAGATAKDGTAENTNPATRIAAVLEEVILGVNGLIFRYPIITAIRR